MDITALAGETIILYAITELNKQLVDQPTNYPTVQIEYVTGGTPTEIVSEAVMTEIIDGEYYYAWAVPSSIEGRCKIRYKASINSADRYGYDFVNVMPYEKYYKLPNEYRSFTYLPSKNVDEVDIDFDNESSPKLQHKISFTYDAEDKVTKMDVEKV